MNAGRDLDALVAEKVMGVTKQQFTAMFRPSTDIQCAWLVVEKLKLSVMWTGKKWGAGEAWDIYFHREDDPEEDDAVYDGSIKHWATSDTAPHAICLAALKAVRVAV